MKQSTKTINKNFYEYKDKAEFVREKRNQRALMDYELKKKAQNGDRLAKLRMETGLTEKEILDIINGEYDEE